MGERGKYKDRPQASPYKNSAKGQRLFPRKGGGILLCSFCVAYMQKDRKKQQDLHRIKMLKTRMNKGKTRISAGL